MEIDVIIIIERTEIAFYSFLGAFENAPDNMSLLSAIVIHELSVAFAFESDA